MDTNATIGNNRYIEPHDSTALPDADQGVQTMWVVGRKIGGKWSFVSRFKCRAGRTGRLDKALLFGSDGDGFDLALALRNLPGDHLMRVCEDDGKLRLGV